jgi:hypothetical protein
MATLPTNASLTGATTTNAQQKTNFTAILTFLGDLLGTDSTNPTAARAALGAIGAPELIASLAGSGYIKIPTSAGGAPLLIQWGQATCGAVSLFDITFPIAFPTSVFSCSVSNYNDAHSVNEMVWRQTAPVPNTTLRCGLANSNSATAILWMAIGR